MSTKRKIERKPWEQYMHSISILREYMNVYNKNRISKRSFSHQLQYIRQHTTEGTYGRNKKPNINILGRKILQLS